MNINDYTYLINNPNAITEKQTDELSNVLNEFPYFQSARALRLKGLYNQDSFKYNYALKVTAAHTTDRAVLFDFMTSETFPIIQKEYHDKKVSDLLNIKVVDNQHLLPEAIESVESKTDPVKQSILSSIKESSIANIEVNTETTEEATKIAEENLEMGKPLNFSAEEKHSFQEWLQLAKTEPIERKEEKQEIPAIETELSSIEMNEEKKKKAALIDKFIETSPKISPVKSPATVATNIQIDINKDNNPHLMTETLAKVYLEQKKYAKAIQAYEILILKYPEKISFFADRISDIKTLQQNNN